MFGRVPLDRHQRDLAGFLFRLFLRLLVHAADNLRDVEPGLLLDPGEQFLLRLFPRKTRDLLQAVRLLLAHPFRFGFALLHGTLARIEPLAAFDQRTLSVGGGVLFSLELVLALPEPAFCFPKLDPRGLHLIVEFFFSFQGFAFGLQAGLLRLVPRFVLRPVDQRRGLGFRRTDRPPRHHPRYDEPDHQSQDQHRDARECKSQHRDGRSIRRQREHDL